MTLLIAAFLAGILTVAAPCVLPLLPVIVGGSIVGAEQRRNWKRPVTIAVSLAVSIVIFTLLLRASTSLLGIPQQVWWIISGGLVSGLGLHFLFPGLWERITGRFNLNARSGKLLTKGRQRQGMAGDITLGAALGPAFNSCSPTYALILATILPRSFEQGVALIVSYAIGLAAALLVISFAGQAAIRKLGWLTAPNSRFRRSIGALMILVGVAVIIGLDRQAQTYILDQGWYDPIAEFEQGLGL